MKKVQITINLTKETDKVLGEIIPKYSKGKFISKAQIIEYLLKKWYKR